MSGFYGTPSLQAVTQIGASTAEAVTFNGAVDLNNDTTLNGTLDIKVDSITRGIVYANFGDNFEARMGFDGTNLILDALTGGSGAIVFVGDGSTGGEIKAGKFSTVSGSSEIYFNSSTSELEFYTGGVKVLGATSTLLTAYVATSGFGGGGGGGGNSVTTTINFGAGFNDRAQAIVTGQTWVTSTSEIVATIKTPAGVDPDEMYLIDPKVVISNIVAGTGFTVTIYSAPEARGSYEVMCVGV